MGLTNLPMIASEAASDTERRVARVVAEFAAAPANSEVLADRVRRIILDPFATWRTEEAADAIADVRGLHAYTDDFERFVDRVLTASGAC